MLNVEQVRQSEVYQTVWHFIDVVCDNERPVEAVVTKQLKLLGVVVTSQSLLAALHVEDVQD